MDGTMVHHIYVYMQVLRQGNNLGACRGEYRELGLAGGSWGCCKFPSGSARGGAPLRKFFASQRPIDWKIQIWWLSCSFFSSFFLYILSFRALKNF